MAAKLAAGLKWFVVGVIDSFMVMLLLMKAFFGSSLAREHRPSFGKLFKGWQTCRYFGRNLGSLNSKLNETRKTTESQLSHERSGKCITNRQWETSGKSIRVSSSFLPGGHLWLSWLFS